jgi:F0F1-type ATP synthase assembly protein I
MKRPQWRPTASTSDAGMALIVAIVVGAAGMLLTFVVSTPRGIAVGLTMVGAGLLAAVYQVVVLRTIVLAHARRRQP